MATAAILTALLPALIQGGVSLAGGIWGDKDKKTEYDKVSRYSPTQESYLDSIAEQLGMPTDKLFDYINDMLSDNPEALQKFQDVAMRDFNEEIIPGIAEQFSGQGVTPQQSSAFTRSLSQAGAGLTEKLAHFREGLKPQAANLLSGFTNLGTTPTFALQERSRETNPFGAFAEGFSGGFGDQTSDLRKQLGELLNKKTQPSTSSVLPKTGAPGI